MKIQQAKVTNFASYDTLEFDFHNQGLTLISGPTGAGKSTVLDIVPWILFGVTAKGGSVEEILSWPGDKVTEGTIWLDNITISRKRGPRGKDNDLMFWPVNGKVTRGKDLSDTQKLINDFLGINAEQYLLGAYFHEFSETSRFFTTTAKNRRQLTENICDFSTPNKIKETAKNKLKSLKLILTENETQHRVLNGQFNMLHTNMQVASLHANHWTKQNADKIKELVEKQRNFEADKAETLGDIKEKSKRFEKERVAAVRDLAVEIYALEQKTKDEDYFTQVKENIAKLLMNIDDDICQTCGAPKDSVKKMALTEDLHSTKILEQENNYNIKKLKNIRKDRDKALAAINPYLDQISRENAKENTFAAQVTAANDEQNPYNEQFNEARRKHVTVGKEMDVLIRKRDDLKVEVSDLELLADLTDVYRTSLVNSAIIDLERKTNNYLSEHFDAEIKVRFESAGADKLEVNISKDGNSAVFTQLSKGQRQLLKLCFAVAIMRSVQNYAGVDFNVLFFDEAFEGLSEQLKIQSYGLLQKLAIDYDSVFVVEHSQELKAMFTNKIEVELENGKSVIYVNTEEHRCA